MENEATSIILGPVVQYGFGGFCAVQFGIIVWLIRRNGAMYDKLIGVLEQTNEVVLNNTQAVQNLTNQTHETKDALYEMRDKLLTRRCIAKQERD